MDVELRSIMLFAYEMHGGRGAWLWSDPRQFHEAMGPSRRRADDDFREWRLRKRNFTPEEVPVGKWVKVSDLGSAFLVECHGDGTLTEASLFDPSSSRSGSWKIVGSALRINVWEYEIDVIANRNANVHSGLEFKAGADAPTAYFKVIHVA